MRLLIVIDVSDENGVSITGNHMGMKFPVHQHFVDNLMVAQTYFPVDQQKSAALSLTKLHDAARGINRKDS